jgi:hypothetical protein
MRLYGEKVSGYKVGTKVMYVVSSQQNVSNEKKIKKLDLSPVMVGYLASTAAMIVLDQLRFFKESIILGQGQSRPYYEGSYHMNAFAAFMGGL